MSTKQKILKCSDTRTMPFSVPEWGLELHLRTLSGAEWSSVLSKIVELEKKGKGLDSNTMICLHCLSEPNGSRIFADNDFDALASKDGAVLNRIAQAAAVFAGLRGEPEKKSSSVNPG
ncbi:unnamed protein product [Gemmata massiliana]|uniref:Phage tail protein n=1 Tax=Gemmata massiliana TaxID=1210884 RepID=A0A6P2D148_9BACT|nr:hypothetical protein [Gemmata massiliana]VTR94085.1 unnamed protein product [Gemmata massiliana]